MQGVVAHAIGEAMMREAAIGFRSHRPMHEILLPVGRADGITDPRGEECLHMGQPDGGTRRGLSFRFPIRVRWVGHGLCRWIHAGEALIRPTTGGSKDQCCRPPKCRTSADVLREISSCRY